MPDPLLRVALAILLSAAMVVANAACPNTEAVYVFKTKNRDGFLFYYLLGDLTFRFVVAGESFRMDDGRIPGQTLYEIDDKTFQVQRVDRKNFAPFVRGEEEDATLEAQARYEQHYISTMAPEARITDLGTRKRTAHDGGSPKVFRLWKYEIPDNKGAPAYFLSTLLDKDTVAMVAANLPGGEDAALEALRAYALSLAPVSAADCDAIKWP